MTQKQKPKKTSRRQWRWLAIGVLLLALFASAVVYALEMKRDRGSTPKLVNRPTAARQVKPLSEKRDSRFAPLPIEQEKHGK